MAASVPINSTLGSWTYLVRGSWTRIARCTVRALTRNIKKDPGISFSRTTAFSAALLCRSLIAMSYGSHMNAWFVPPIVIPIAQFWISQLRRSFVSRMEGGLVFSSKRSDGCHSAGRNGFLLIQIIWFGSRWSLAGCCSAVY